MKEKLSISCVHNEKSTELLRHTIAVRIVGGEVSAEDNKAYSLDWRTVSRVQAKIFAGQS